jgi:hypothetical protein
MFGLFGTKVKKAVVVQQDATPAMNAVMDAAKSVMCWKMCVDESAASNGGMRLSRIDILVWADVANRFIKTTQLHGNISLNEKAQLEERMNAYLMFIKFQVLENNHLFTQEELEKIGEFIAVAAISGIVMAILSDIEKASIIHDLLPKEWLIKAGINHEKFDDTYFSMTGKRRKYRDATG